MFTWALVGSPNSGKTTLYNWLTGAKSKAVNYPGSTVEYSVGYLRENMLEKFNNSGVQIIDTPGAYSLQPQSEDEQVTHNVLFSKNHHINKIDGVVVVVDSTQLERHLCVVKQVIHSGYRPVVVMTMLDLLEKEKCTVQLEQLKSELNCEVILFDGILGRGLDDIASKLCSPEKPEQNPEFTAWSEQQQTDVLLWASRIAKKVLIRDIKKNSAQSFSNQIDNYLLHPIFGFVFFFAIMTLLFASIYWFATPFMDQIDSVFSRLSDLTTENIDGLFGEFIGAGLVSALGGVVIFVPQIFILFLGIGILESSGYLARVAALIDKPLTWVGLGGRSFVPLLSGFACAIPGIMATRNITSKKEKLIAQSVIPFMTCSARLPVYALLIGFLYGDGHPLMAGLFMALLYFGAILIGAIAARIIAMFIKDKTSSSRLMMELPYYRRPKMMTILNQAFMKSKSFVTKAGPIIFILALVLWASTNFPRPQLMESSQQIDSAAIAQQSYAAQAGKFIEPIFKPMGVDWRVGFALISAFAAREVFVSALVLMFNVDGNDEEAQTKGLLNAMKEARFEDGTMIFSFASVVGILVFFMIALQCASTVGILKKEMGSWKYAITHLVLSNMAAYGLAVAAVYSIKLFVN